MHDLSQNHDNPLGISGDIKVSLNGSTLDG